MGLKFYNESRYDLLDLKFEVCIKTPFYSHGGQNFKIDRLTLKKDRIMLLPKQNQQNKQSGSFALIMTTRDDLEGLWKQDAQLVEFNVHARHSFSGATKSFSKIFYTKSTSVKEGMFTFGKTNAIK